MVEFQRILCMYIVIDMYTLTKVEIIPLNQK